MNSVVGWKLLVEAASTSTEQDLLQSLARRLAEQQIRISSVAGLGPHLEEAEVPILAGIVARLGQTAGLATLPLSAHDRHRMRARNYMAKKSLEGREIGPLPPVVDPERREGCARDAALYLKTYHAPAFPLDWSISHEIAIQRAQIVITLGALFALAMPRGSGKTTLCRHLAQWAINYAYRRYVYLIGASDEKGSEALDAVILNYETNELLLADFPEICYPIWKLEGIHNRAKGQLLGGERTRIEFTKRALILPTVPGSQASGSLIKAGGLLSSLRGANHHLPDGSVIRPDLVLIDDPQTRESAESPQQSATRLRIITADVLGMAGPGQPIAALMPCTVVAPGDAVDQVLDMEAHPEWRPLRCKLLESFPDAEAMVLWEQYWDIFEGELKRLAGASDQEEGFAVPPKATAFYKKNRAAMDCGAKVTWEARHRPDELSALQHAMNLYFRDPEGFASEYQNEPVDQRVEETFLRAEQIARKTSAYHRAEVPLECEWITGAIDVHLRVLMWSIIAVTPEFTIHVLDYGAFPKQNRPTFRVSTARPTLKETYKGAGDDGAVLNGLKDLMQALAAVQYKREDGLAMALSMGLVDTAYNSATVKKAIRQAGMIGTFFPSFGKAFGANETPINAYRQKAGERLGEEWILRRAVARMRHMLIDVNYWKTFVARRLLTAAGDAGSLTLFGREANGRKVDHSIFARQLDSEVRKVDEGDRRVDLWTRRPNAENHWLDTLVYSCVAASYMGAKIGGTDLRERRPRRSLAERRAARRRREED